MGLQAAVTSAHAPSAEEADDADVDRVAPAEGVTLTKRGLCVHLVGATLNGSRKSDTGRGDSLGVYVTMWLSGPDNKPIGAAAQWECRECTMSWPNSRHVHALWGGEM